MNRNDKKRNRRSEKGLVDPRSIQEYIVHRKTTLMEFLFFKRPDLSRNTIKSLLTHHQVAVGGVPVSQYDYPLVEEDVVLISKRSIAKHQVHDLPILYEDSDIIAMDKPSGLLSIASDREKGKTAYRLINDYVRANNPKARVYVVHRLDEDTSGVLVFAKSAEVKEALQTHWQEIVTNRFYYAIVEGEMESESADYNDYLGENNLHLVYVTKNKANGKLAKTSYKVIKYTEPYSLLDVHIFSGRKNQIRVQLGHRGHYVIGDDKYGEPSDPIDRLGLHAYRLTFKNPISGKTYDLVSEMPESFKGLIFGKKMTNGKIAKAKEQKARKAVRDTRTETRIKKGKNSFKGFRNNMKGKKR